MLGSKPDEVVQCCFDWRWKDGRLAGNETDKLSHYLWLRGASGSQERVEAG